MGRKKQWCEINQVVFFRRRYIQRASSHADAALKPAKSQEANEYVQSDHYEYHMRDRIDSMAVICFLSSHSNPRNDSQHPIGVATTRYTVVNTFDIRIACTTNVYM